MNTVTSGGCLEKQVISLTPEILNPRLGTA
jgi:hypothetical protein